MQPEQRIGVDYREELPMGRTSLNSIFMQAPAAIAAVRGSAHRFELVNAAFQRLFGVRDAIGRPAREAAPVLQELGIIDKLDEVYRGGQPLAGVEIRVPGEGGGTVVHLALQPLQESEGRTGGVIIAGFEVTDAARPRPTDATVARREELPIFINAVKDYAIFMLDRNGYLTSWNAGAARIKGYRADEVIGKHFSIFYAPEDVANGKPAWILEQARTRGSVEDEGWRVRKDGTLFWADVVVTAVFDADGNVRGFAKVTRDLTERMRAEATQRALLKAEEQRRIAEEATRAKDEFMATLSHELRTPLTSILGWARMLRLGMLDRTGQAEALEALERSGQTLAHLVEDLLDTARITAGKLRLDKKAIDLRTVIEAAIADVTPSAESKKILLTANIEGSYPMEGDPTRLQQVAWNLLTNAIKFTPAGGRITVNLRADEHCAVLEVRDTGRGIEPERVEHLFTRYYQDDPAAKDRKGGLGLGLSLVRHLAMLHGGTVEAASEGPGRGSTFTVKLPLAIAASRA